jgi:hypothetical protein
MQVKAEIEPDNPVFYISWLRETQGWWPAWGAHAVAAGLALIPAKGRLGIGLAIFAGLALVPNLWRTYALTMIAAGVLVLLGVRDTRERVREDAVARPQPQLQNPVAPGEP